MRVLLIDTCGAAGGIALADLESTDPIVAFASLPGRTASERLVGVIREAMKNTGWTFKQLAAIGVVTGPGSFTGVRVGLSAAKGLGEATGVPLIALSRLATLAAKSASSALVCALIDAGREEFYCGLYGSAEPQESLMTKAAAITAAAHADAVVACEDSVAGQLGKLTNLTMVEEPTAADALPFVAAKLRLGLFDDPITLDANYLRRTDAEIFAKPAAKRAG